MFINELPIHIKTTSQICKSFTEEYPGQNVRVPENIRPFKLDLLFRCLRDVLEIIDTCAFFDAEIPWEVFDFAYGKAGFYLDMEKYEADIQDGIPTGLDQYACFIDTPEYHALKLCSEFTTTRYSQIPSGIITFAINRNSLLLIRYYEKKCKYLFPRNISIGLEAVRYGRIEIMEYLSKSEWFRKSLSEQWNARQIHVFCEYAAMSGKLDMLRFLREKLKYNWKASTVEAAIIKRRYDCLVYAVKNGCPIPECSLDKAILINSFDIVKFLVEYGVPITQKHKESALNEENADIIEFLNRY